MNNKRKIFITKLRETKDEETKNIELLKQYRAGKIKEEELTKEQKEKISKLYDKQIETLRKSNEHRKEKILKYRKQYPRPYGQNIKKIIYFWG